MNAQTLNAAISEAEIFLVKARELRKKHNEYLNVRAETDKKSKEQGEYLWCPASDPYTGSPISGSVRRKSLDLTRALADLRRR